MATLQLIFMALVQVYRAKHWFWITSENELKAYDEAVLLNLNKSWAKQYQGKKLEASIYITFIIYPSVALLYAEMLTCHLSNL